MDYNFTHAVLNAEKYEREEMLSYLLSKINNDSVSFLDEMKCGLFVESTNKYSFEELQRRLK